MKRVLGFILGAVLGTALAYTIRKTLERQKQAASNQLAISKKAVVPPSVNVAPTANGTPNYERPSAKFTVRRTGPRPQVPTDSETVINNPSDTHALTTPPAELEPAEKASIKTEAASLQTSQPASSEDTKTKTADQPADDFTPIYDLGEISNRKLHEAGIKTFAALVATPIEKLSEITGFPVARIERSEWLQQADQLAKGLPLKIPEQQVEPTDER